MDERKRRVVLENLEYIIVKPGRSKDVISADIDPIDFLYWRRDLRRFRSHQGFHSNKHPEAQRMLDSGFNPHKYYTNTKGVWGLLPP
jgi:hypothetical protein